MIKISCAVGGRSGQFDVWLRVIMVIFVSLFSAGATAAMNAVVTPGWELDVNPVQTSDSSAWWTNGSAPVNSAGSCRCR